MADEDNTTEMTEVVRLDMPRLWFRIVSMSTLSMMALRKGKVALSLETARRADMHLDKLTDEEDEQLAKLLQSVHIRHNL